MKKMILSLTVVLLTVACCNKQQRTAAACCESQAADSTAIEQLINSSYRNALAASDTVAIKAAYTTDGVVMGPGVPTAAGSPALAMTYNAIFCAVKLNLKFHIDEMIIGQRYAFVRSVSTGTATIDGTEAKEDNRELFVVRKEDDSWKIARYIYNKQDTYKATESTKVTTAGSREPATADTGVIRALITSSYQQALNGADAEAVAAAYAEDAVVMSPDAPTVAGNANIQNMYQGLFSGMQLSLTFHIDEIVTDGNYGYVRSHSDGNVTINGATVPASYREIFVVKKVGKEWKIAWYEYNQPTAN